MPQSARSLTTAYPKPAIPFEDCEREYGRVISPPLHKAPGVQGRRRSHPLYGAETWVFYRKQIRLVERFHQRCSRSTLGIKWQDHVSNEEVLKRVSLPSIRVHLASGETALGWQRHKDGRRTHAQSSLLQRSPGRKARSGCSKKALQRPAEETACTGGNQPSVMAVGGLRPRQLALIGKKSQL